MIKRKICVVITARPSYARIKTALEAINEDDKLELQIVVAASGLLERYGSVIKNIKSDGFEITAKVFNVIEGENLISAAKTTGIGILELTTVFDNIKPDIVITIADRFETMATAIAASYMNIPLAHIQGGEITGNIDEKVRHAITKLADYHLVASKSAMDRVLSLGENPVNVFNTGCPSIDLAGRVMIKPHLDYSPVVKYKGVGASIDCTKDYMVVLQHSVTEQPDESRHQIEQTLKAVYEIEIPTFWFWPNVDAGSDGISKGLRIFRESYTNNNIHFIKNMKPEDFLLLLIKSCVLIGNSSVGIRECAYLGVPVVNIGTRQKGRDRGNNVIDVDYKSNEIMASVQKWLSTSRPEPSDIYGGGDAGTKISEIMKRIPL
jgi:UDP-hydrolysing UDP-N-acetyl-D-glucosamine 2-epimerase